MKQNLTALVIPAVKINFIMRLISLVNVETDSHVRSREYSYDTSQLKTN